MKEKERISKGSKRKNPRVIYKGTPIRLPANFYTETLPTGREWHDMFKVLKGKTLQPRLLYPERLSFIAGEMNKNKAMHQC